MDDAASEEGIYYESANFAALKQLPVIFFRENNLYTVYSPLDVRVPSNRDLVKLPFQSGQFDLVISILRVSIFILQESGNGFLISVATGGPFLHLLRVRHFEHNPTFFIHVDP